MSSKLLKTFLTFKHSGLKTNFTVENFNKKKYYSMASMICGDDSSCDTDGDNHGCGCNA